MKKSKSLIIGAIVFVVLLFLIYTVWVISTPLPLEIQGEVEATQINVASKLVGRIDSLAVKRGETVLKGDLLYVVSSPEIEAKLEQAQAVKQAAQATRDKAQTGAREEDIVAAYNIYLKAQAAAEFAEKSFERISNLFAEGVVPEQKRDETETQMKAAQRTAEAAKATWEMAKNGARIEDKDAAEALLLQAEGVISEVQAYLKERYITAPISGEIANIIAESGELVSSGLPVVSIVDLTDIWVTFNIREDLLANIKMGTEFDAKFPALGGQSIKLKVSYITVLGSYATWNATKTAGDFDMKTFEVRATPVEKVENLRPGMSAIVNWEQFEE